jgi:hypothetical protein
MDYFAGLDVSVKETSICIVDDAGKIVREVKVASEPEALLAVLKNPAYHFKRIGLEAGQARRLRTGPAFSASVVTPSRWRPSGAVSPVSFSCRPALALRMPMPLSPEDSSTRS